MLATLSHDTSVVLAEVGFLLLVIAGVWLAFTVVQPERWRTMRTIVAGAAISVAGVLLIIATHWGSFG